MSGNAQAGYYSRRLGGERLRQCYALASPRVRQYLDAEIEFVRSRLEATDDVLELGCGYGRVTLELAGSAGRVVGIDTSVESLELARALAGEEGACDFLEMDASALAFDDSRFDAVVCVQNGVCAFGVDPVTLVSEALRVARTGGRVLFSTYASGFWANRLEWFEAQARAGLVGEIDIEATGDGTIVCRDGLTLRALTEEDWEAIGSGVGSAPEIVEVDGSSVFAIWVAERRTDERGPRSSGEEIQV